MSKPIVLDSSVVLGALLYETMQDVALRAVTGGAFISAVNLSEVLAKLQERGASEQDAEAAVERLGLTVVPFDNDQAKQAARWRRATKGFGLGLGDRACIALGNRLEGEILTLDRAWTQVASPAPILYVRG